MSLLVCEDIAAPDGDMTHLTPPQRLSVWAIARLPRIVVTDTLQVALAFAWFCLGVGSLLTLGSPSVTSQALGWIVLRVEWSVTLILGGLLQVYGLQRASRMWERSGMSLAAVGTLTYGFALVAAGRPVGWVMASAFLVFSIAYGVRLMASTAARVRRFP